MKEELENSRCLLVDRAHWPLLPSNAPWILLFVPIKRSFQFGFPPDLFNNQSDRLPLATATAYCLVDVAPALA